MGQQNREAINKKLHLDDSLQEIISHYLPSSSEKKTLFKYFPCSQMAHK